MPKVQLALYIHVLSIIIKQNFEKNCPFFNLTQSPHLRLAGLVGLGPSVCIIVEYGLQE